MTTNDWCQPLRDRIAAGKRVTVADVAEVAALDAETTLATLRADVAAQREAVAKDAARKAHIEALLGSFEAEADRVIDRMESVGAKLMDTLAELAAVQDDFDRVHRGHLEQLHEAGWNVADGSSPVIATGGRVVMDRDFLGKLKVHAPFGSSLNQGTRSFVDAALYARWGRTAQKERARIQRAGQRSPC